MRAQIVCGLVRNENLELIVIIDRGKDTHTKKEITRSVKRSVVLSFLKRLR